jgi:ribonuclease HI
VGAAELINAAGEHWCRSPAGLSATVICDASFCPETKAAAWATWITYQRGSTKERIKRSGWFHHQPASPYEAERWACYNGLWLASKVDGIARVLVQTDCLDVVQRRHADWSSVELGSIEVAWRHVKGHTLREESRFYVNRWCDEEARRLMREQRAKLRRRKK